LLKKFFQIFFFANIVYIIVYPIASILVENIILKNRFVKKLETNKLIDINQQLIYDEEFFILKMANINLIFFYPNLLFIIVSFFN
jgi:hypothetical protein